MALTSMPLTEKKRASARRVRPLFFKLLRRASPESIRELQNAIQHGTFDGKRYDTCVYGNLAKGAGYNFVGKTPDEIRSMLREYGKTIGIEIRADGHLDQVEKFLAHAGRGNTPTNCDELYYTYNWCDFALVEKGCDPFAGIEEVVSLAGEAVSA